MMVPALIQPLLQLFRQVLLQRLKMHRGRELRFRLHVSAIAVKLALYFKPQVAVIITVITIAALAIGSKATKCSIQGSSGSFLVLMLMLVLVLVLVTIQAATC